MCDPDMAQITCDTCGISFLVPRVWMEQRERDHKWWWCPNGHSWSYCEDSKEEKLEKQLNARNREIDNLEYHRDYYKRSAAAQKGVVTKLRNRLEAEDE